MSPLARIRQVAACIALCVSADLALAADPAPQPAAGAQSAQPSQPSQPAAPPVQAVGQPAQSVPAAQSTPTAQPAPVVQLAPNVAARIAHSALLTIDGTATADSVVLSIRRVSDKSVVSSDDVTVTVDGKTESVTRESGGGYELPSNDLRGAHDTGTDVEIVVGHDGIREILSGKVAVAHTGSADSLLRDHKQVAWWILNIVIVLIAAIVLSRRKG